jgi:ATPase subunit of ABC transporter with duplicated ATPase domains
LSDVIDVDTIRSLEEALLEFGGCALVVSHDRFFLDRICTHILAYEGDSNIRYSVNASASSILLVLVLTFVVSDCLSSCNQ